MDLIKIKLIKPHTHAGKSHGVGDELQVDAIDAQWLQDKKIGVPANPDGAPPAGKPGKR